MRVIDFEDEAEFLASKQLDGLDVKTLNINFLDKKSTKNREDLNLFPRNQIETNGRSRGPERRWDSS
jgi:hypothetical protein